METERDLYRFERYFRHADGSTNLLDHIGEPYLVRPSDIDQIFNIEGVRLQTFGQGVLARQEGWGTNRGANKGLYLREIVQDPFGKRIHHTASETWVLDSASAWASGVFHRAKIIMDSSRIGTPVNYGTLTLDYGALDIAAGFTSGKWVSPWHNLDARSSVHYVAWEIDDAVDRQGNELSSYSIHIRISDSGSISQWYEITQVSAGSPDPYREQGGPLSDPGDPAHALSLPADSVQVRVEMHAADPQISNPQTANDLLDRPPYVRRLKVYSELALEEFYWASLGDLMLEADYPVQAFAQGAELGGSVCDVIYVEIPLASILAGQHQERLEMIYKGVDGGLKLIRGVIDGTVEYTKDIP